MKNFPIPSVDGLEHMQHVANPIFAAISATIMSKIKLMSTADAYLINEQNAAIVIVPTMNPIDIPPTPVIGSFMMLNFF